MTNELNSCFIFAARYAHDRNTGAARQVVNSILGRWDELDPRIKIQLIAEARNDAMYDLEDWQRLIDAGKNLDNTYGE